MKISIRSFYFIIVIIILCLVLWGATGLAATSTPPAIIKTTTPPGMIMGRATMPDELSGIAGCEVQLLYHGDILFAKTNTDADGNFIFTNVAPNDDTWGYRLIVKDGTWGESATQQFDVFSNKTTIVGVRVYPYIGSFSFVSDRYDLDADGNAVVNLAVTLLDVNGKRVPDGVHVTFDQASFYPNPGKFSKGLVNGTNVQMATKNGSISLTYGVVPGDTLSRGVRLTATCDETMDAKAINLTFNLVNPNAIEGTVYDATGRPVPFAKVFLSRWDGVSKFSGYNSSESIDRTDNSGVCNANGFYRFAIMPAGTYQVTANESTFLKAGTVTVARGKYVLDITLPMNRGSIHGWVKDNKGNTVAGVPVSLYRVYGTSLSLMANNVTIADGSFRFDDIWYGGYALQAVYAGQTADQRIILDANRTTVTLPLIVDAHVVTPTPAPTPANVTPTVAPHGNTTVTPRPPTPTPPPITPSYLISSYGVALGTMALICVGILLVMLRLRPK
jgi:hypothetical protein